MDNTYLIQHLFEKMASSDIFSNKEFIKDGISSYTYYEFYNKCKSFSYNITKGAKIEKGDRILLLIDNSCEFYVSFVASLLLGGIVVPISSKSSLNKICEIMSDCEASVILCMSNDVLNACKCFEDQVYVANVCNFCEKGEEFLIENTTVDIDPAMIIYTSGTTGKKKGIICSHLNVLSSIDSIRHYLKLKHNDIVLNALPPFFDYGLYQFLLCASCGAKLILEPDFVFIDSIIDSIKSNEVTVLPLMPTIATTLSEYIEKTNCDISFFNTIRIITSTGSKLYKSQIDNLRKYFRKSKIFSMYGLTECKRVSFLDPMLIDLKPDSVGKPMPNVHVEIVDDVGNNVDVGQVGVLIVKGSNVCMGYWNDMELTNQVFITNELNQKKLVTNDLFYMDEDGDLYFVGRTDDIVKCNGIRISLQEISKNLMSFNEIKEVLIEAKEDEKLGKRIVSYIVLHSDMSITVQQIKNKLLRSDEFCPQEILFVDSLPKTENGKISNII